MDIFLNHHYYLEYYEDERLSGIESLNTIFDWFKSSNYYKVSGNNIEGTFICEFESKDQFGSESVMITRFKKGMDYYVYPIILSLFKYENRLILAISYPYKILQFLTADLQRLENVTEIGIDFDKIVEHMSSRNLKKDFAKSEIPSFDVNIIKYTALIFKNVGKSNVIDEKHISKASHVYLKGTDPLNSDVYNHLVNTKEFQIEHLAGRLQILDVAKKGTFSVAFDQKGNFRYYLQKLDFNKSLDLIVGLFIYLKSINSLVIKTRSTSKVLENAEFI